MSSLLDKFKSDVPIISDGFKDLSGKISKMTPDDYPKQWLKWAESFKVTDEAAVQFFSDVDSGKKNIKDINTYIDSASKSSSTFSANLKKVSATLKSVAANMVIMLAINVAVQTLSKVWDNLNVTVEEQKDKVDSLKASYKELNSEYGSLKDKDSLSSYEKDRLSYLERRLDLDKQILEIEQKQLYKEQIGTGNWTDAFDEDSLLNKKSRELNTRPNADNLAGVSARSTKEIEKYLSLSEKLKDIVKEQSELEEGRTAKSEYLERRMVSIQEKEANSLKELQEYQDELVLKQGEYLENAQIAQEAVDSGLLTGKDLASAQEMADYWNQMYQDALGIQFSIQKATNTYNPGEKNGLVRRASNKFGNISDSDMGTFSEEDLELILELDVDPDSITSVEELKAKVEEVKLGVEETNETPLSIGSVSSLIDQLNNQLKPAFDSLQSAYQDIFTTDEDGKDIFTLEDVDISMFSDIKSAIDEINEIEGIDIDVSSFDDLASILADSSSTADEVQNAFNNIASAVLNGTNAMDGMDDSTAQLVSTMLESLGVSNAEEVVTHNLALAKEKARIATLDLANSTSISMAGLLNEANAAGITKAEIYNLAATEIAYGNNGLDFSGKISKLQELANAYGDTATQAMLAAAADRVANGHGTPESVMADMVAQFKKATPTTMVSFSKVGGGSGAAGKAGENAAKKYVERFEEELSELDRLKDIGVLSEKGFLDKLRKLYNRYYRDKEEYLKEYQEQEKDYLEGKHITCPLLQ